MNIFEAYLINKGSFRNIIAKFYIKGFGKDFITRSRERTFKSLS